MSYDARESSQFGGQPFELYQFQMDGAAWYLTSADEPKTYLGNSFTPEAIKRTSPGQGSEMQSGTLTVTVPVGHPVAQLFIAYIPATPLMLTIFRGHEGEAESETIVLFTGKVTSAQFGDFCELTCAPEQQILKKQIPAPRYQSPCNRTLYDSGCGVDRAAFKVTGVLTAVNATVIRAAAFATKPHGWLTAGYIEKGNERRMILDHTGDTLTLIAPLALSAGETVAAYAGCMRDYATCRNKFSNGDRFFGFQWVPNRNPFNGVA